MKGRIEEANSLESEALAACQTHGSLPYEHDFHKSMNLEREGERVAH